MFGGVDALELDELKQLRLLNKHINATKKTLSKSGGGIMFNNTKIKYATVEALKKNATRASTPESGLFKGIKIRSEKKEQEAKVVQFLLLGGSNNVSDLSALNLDDTYNVMSIKMQCGDTKELMVFKANDVDQEKAIETLKSIVRELAADKRMVANDPEIIDVETYADLPAEFANKNVAKADIVGANNTNKVYDDKYYKDGGGLGGLGGLGGVGGCHYDSDDWQKKQEAKAAEKERQDKMRETPALIQRSGEKPQLKQLNIMKKKVAMILAGEYTTKLPDLKGLSEETDSDLDSDGYECYSCINSISQERPNVDLLVCRECDDSDNFNADSDEYEKEKGDKAGAGAHQSGDSSFVA